MVLGQLDTCSRNFFHFTQDRTPRSKVKTRLITKIGIQPYNGFTRLVLGYVFRLKKNFVYVLYGKVTSVKYFVNMGNHLKSILNKDEYDIASFDCISPVLKNIKQFHQCEFSDFNSQFITDTKLKRNYT